MEQAVAEGDCYGFHLGLQAHIALILEGKQSSLDDFNNAKKKEKERIQSPSLSFFRF